MLKILFISAFLLSIAHINAKSQYEIINLKQTASSITIDLRYYGKQQYFGNPKSPIIKNLQFILQVHSFSDFCIKIKDLNNDRFQVPQRDMFPIDPMRNFSFPLAASGIIFQSSNKPFDFKILRKETSSIIFSTYSQDFIYSDHYIQIGTQVESRFVYGIGQRFQESFRKKDGRWTIFNRDRGQMIDHGTGLQTYGYYPFYLMRQRQNYFHINYFRSSNAMDAIKSSQGNRHFVVFKTIGGIVDLRFFLGEKKPAKLIEKLNQYSGRSAIPPFWSLGFHQSRWGYRTVGALQNVIQNFQKNDIPLEVIWSDIDYMLHLEDFTIDQLRFPLDRMAKITEKYRYIPIIDAGIKATGYAYEQGLKRNVYVMDATGKKPYKGLVWPGVTTFVDFFHPNATQYWIDMLARLYQKVKFSGIWLDMNQYSNFCNGPCTFPQETPVFDYSKDLPYQPGHDNIESQTISLNATHYGNISEANVHVFSAFLETYSTYTFLKKYSERPFIITRSSTFGSNKFGFHWTGDNKATWEYLKGSIADNFNNNMFGFQMVGPDICGFGGNTNEQLCARWFQIGSLYTFCRNHNEIAMISQEPYALGPVVLQAAKNNLRLRYSLLKYFYFLFIDSKGIGSIWEPLFFYFPDIQACYQDEIADTQFMISYLLMAAPIVEQGKKERTVYFPEVNWFDLYTGQRYTPGKHTISNIGLTDKVPLYVRESFIVFTQKTQKVTRISQLDNHFDLFSGMELNSTFTNDTYKIFNSVGFVLSIANYSEQSKISDCIKNGCSYTFKMAAFLTSIEQKLQLDIYFSGSPLLQEKIFIDQIKLNLDGTIFTANIDFPIEIQGPKKITLKIRQMAIISKNIKEAYQ